VTGFTKTNGVSDAKGSKSSDEKRVRCSDCRDVYDAQDMTLDASRRTEASGELPDPRTFKQATEHLEALDR
jgi:hypothetical protein